MSATTIVIIVFVVLGVIGVVVLCCWCTRPKKEAVVGGGWGDFVKEYDSVD
jgi:heme/copper-type cytochrome/quinol oxidase subunit 2